MGEVVLLEDLYVVAEDIGTRPATPSDLISVLSHLNGEWRGPSGAGCATTPTSPPAMRTTLTGRGSCTRRTADYSEHLADSVLRKVAVHIGEER